MNGAFIADASVGIAWAVGAQSTTATDKLLSDVESGVPFVVPGLWLLEIANSLLVLERRRKIRTHDSADARMALANLNPLVDDEGPRLALGAIYKLASRYSLTVCDAVYLELGMRRRLPLATRDSKLRNAAVAARMEVLL